MERKPRGAHIRPAPAKPAVLLCLSGGSPPRSDRRCAVNEQARRAPVEPREPVICATSTGSATASANDAIARPEPLEGSAPPADECAGASSPQPRTTTDQARHAMRTLGSAPDPMRLDGDEVGGFFPQRERHLSVHCSGRRLLPWNVQPLNHLPRAIASTTGTTTEFPNCL